MIFREFPRLGESLWEDRLPNGLRLRVVPKSDFAQKVAFLAIDFGSIDTSFTLEGVQHRVPDGIAHYLEHKMFDLPDEDPTAKFGEWGANVNAFTGYSMTAYHFSCTDHFADALKLLLRMVCTPYFTPESVEKEQGIIAQEIRMYEDSADSRVYEDLFRSMFPDHPISVPIAGTVDSIAQIDADMLYACHNAFYRPSNMVLCVCGDVDPEEVRRIALDNTPEDYAPLPQRDYGSSTFRPGSPDPRSMAISMPTFTMAFPCSSVFGGLEGMKRELIGELATEILVGESSSLYSRLYEEGLIDADFSAGYESVKKLCFLSLSGDSRDPQAVCEAVLEEGRRIAREGFDEELFRRLLRSSQGRRTRDLDSFSGICYRICAYEFEDFSYFRFPEAYASLTAADVQDFLRQSLQDEHFALSVIYPKED